MSPGRLLVSSLVMLAVVLAGSVASAQAAGPALTVSMAHAPSTFQRLDQSDQFTVAVKNSGDTATTGTVTVTDALPPGMNVRPDAGPTRIGVRPAGGWTCTSTADVVAGALLTCSGTPNLAPGVSSSVVTVLVVVDAHAPDTAINRATASGGGAAASASGSDPTPVVDRPAFDVLGFTARSLDTAGNDYTVAGGHPDHATATFAFPTYTFAQGAGGLAPVEDVKDIYTQLPPGFVGNAGATPRCPLAKLQPFVPSCPLASKVGSIVLGIKGGLSTINVYNLVPEKGYPAEFGFKFANNAVVMYPQVQPRTRQYGLMVSVPGASRLSITSIALTFYGVPSAPAPHGNGTGGAAIPFLSMQSDCLVAQPVSKIIVDSWQHPGRTLDDGTPDLSDPGWKTATAPAPPVTGCDAPALASQFAPTISAVPTPGTGSKQVDAPSGYSVDLAFPQTNDPTDLTTTFDPAVPQAPQLKDTTVTLPAGVAISPSAAGGLEGCSDLASDPAGDQVRLDTTLPVRCPDASKVGTVKATSPLLAAHDTDEGPVTGAETLEGDVYVIKPHPGDLSPAGDQDGKIRLVIQINSERYGLNAKLPGIVTADQAHNGRLTARFEDNPALPVKSLSLKFKAGDRAPLVNPATCAAAATTTGLFTPWSRGGTRSDGLAVLGTPDVTATSAFGISWDGQGALCPDTLPFGPSVNAGTVSQQAGASSPFAFDLTRQDREDVVNGLSVTLPGGLLAAVKDVPLCSDADANAGSCPASSRVGSARVAAGPGGNPFNIWDQPVSLTGPYKGAPYGLAIAVRAVAGPFDLGTVVVRQALNVNPDDTHVTVVSDPLPTIRDGVPLRVRRIHVDIDRPGFMRSPTSCAPKVIGTTVSSLGGQKKDRLSAFQVKDCDKLPFAPKLLMKLDGANETKVGGHPGIEALVTQQPGEAALKSATVTLPLSLALDPDHAVSDSLCSFGDGLKDQCPESSVIGTVTAVSPLLKAPLTGKVFFVKGLRADAKSGRLIATLPTLLVELRGEINVNLRATSSVPDNEHLVTTFPMVPDAAISSFYLKLNGGKSGIIVVTDGHDVCVGPQEPFFTAIGQNGKRVDTKASMTPECPLSVSRKFTSTTLRATVSGIGAGTVTVSGTGIRTTKRTIKSATSATVVAKLTAKGKQMRKAKRDIRVKVTFVPKGATAAKVAYSAKPKKAKRKSAKKSTAKANSKT